MKLLAMYSRVRRIKKRKPFFKQKPFWFAIFLLFFICAFGYLFLFGRFIQVRKINIEGAKRISQDIVRDEIAKLIKRKIFFLPTESIFLVDSQNIKNILLNLFPAIEKVQIKKNIFDSSLTVQIKEREKIGVWCKNNTLSECFSIDNKGIVFEREDPTNSFVIFYSPTKIVELGEEVIPKELMEKILNVRQLGEGLDLFKKREVRFVSLTIPSSSRLNFETSEGWEIYVDPREDIEWQNQKLRAVLERKIPPERRKDLKYIDVRFGNQAYIKYRQ